MAATGKDDQSGENDPKTVTDLKVTAVTHDSFSISWTPPIVSPATYLSYVFRLRPTGSGSGWQLVFATDFLDDAHLTSFRFGQDNGFGGFLQAGHAYDIEVLVQASHRSSVVTATLTLS
jgi:hypothetical protein